MLVRVLSFSVVTALTLNSALAPVVASDYSATPMVGGGQIKARFLALGVGKSVVVDLPRDIKDVLVAGPKIANAVIPSTQRAYIIGAAVGQTNIVFFDSAGVQMAAYDIAVKRDLNGVRAALRQALPYAGVQIEGVGDGVILTGSVSSPIEAQQAGDIAARLVGSPEKVVNSIAVRGRDQVMLKVTVAEVRREIIKQMGVDLSASMNYGTAVVNFNNSNPFTALGRSLVSDNLASVSALTKGLPSVTATLRAMESAGVMRTLAEPNLTAISGESATFIAGGEFPIPAGYSCDPATHRSHFQFAVLGSCAKAARPNSNDRTGFSQIARTPLLLKWNSKFLRQTVVLASGMPHRAKLYSPAFSDREPIHTEWLAHRSCESSSKP
jgi:pilus assembly protein CpaC